MTISSNLLTYFTSDKAEKDFRKDIKQIIGTNPNNISLYYLAFRHTSSSVKSKIKNFKESNERLEFLGDSVLGMVVAEFLFKKYPYKNEGFLTEIRSRIVNRESLNMVARKIGLEKLIDYNGQKVSSKRTSMYGDAMEALIGAIYLDKGFKFTKNYILNQLIAHHFDLDNIINTTSNYKSLILSWSQVEQKTIEFKIVEEKGKNNNRQFLVELLVDNQQVSTGNGWNKKKAEQDAARRACEALKIE